MKFKNLGVLFLLSIASVYFICPVQCAAIREAGEDTTADKFLGHQQCLVGSQTTDETNQSTCCQPENQPTPFHEHQEDKEGHCCFSRWESLGTSEPQFVSQIQKKTFSFILLIPTTPKISSGTVSFAAHLQLPYNPYTTPPIPRLSPRAPPFSLA